jgi:hypothetical protein
MARNMTDYAAAFTTISGKIRRTGLRQLARERARAGHAT